jgi:hypothetical protein
MWDILEDIYVSDNILDYVTDIINSTRKPSDYNLDISKYLNY